MADRMRAIARLVGSAQRVFDIGCGHQQLAAALPDRWVIAADRVPHIVADVGPRIADGRLVADGLTALAATPGCVVCAGMGERAMAAWLQAPALVAAQRLVLNPSPQHYTLRAALAEAGWYCADEDLVYANGRYHVLIAAERGHEASTDQDALLIGPRLVELRHPLLPGFLADALQRRPHARGNSPEACFLHAARRCLDGLDG